MNFKEIAEVTIDKFPVWRPTDGSKSKGKPKSEGKLLLIGET